MNKELLNEILATIKEYDKIIIFPHGRPDGDAIGTSFGLKDILVSSFPKKDIHVAGESSEFTSFLGVPEQLEDDAFKDALAICVDTANSTRLADQRFKSCDKIIKIDHHINVEDYGHINYVDTTRPAAALIILDLLLAFEDELTMTKEGAQALFFGILTDTGRFKYDGVNDVTFRNVASLFGYGLVPREVYNYLDTRTEELTRFKGFMLQNYQKTENGVAYFKVLPEYLDKFNVTLEEASSLVNELGYFKDCPVWLLFAEYEEQIVRARMRSKGPAINELANQFDGGGHKMACGANLGTWDRAEELLKASDALVKEYKETLK
jgi:phosphoesterase RecJ-like protein